MESVYRPYKRLPFDDGRCTRCGECFHRCPVMRLPLDQARREMERLIEGENSPVLRACTSCLACNQFCPEDCRPANLILDRWHEAYLREGLPARAVHFLPHARPNFRTDILDHMPPDEREAVARWEREEPARVFLYPGCNLITAPYLTFSRLFEGTEVRGGLDHCCGEMLFRMGLYEAVEEVAAQLTAWLHRLQAERVYLLCTAGLNMFRNVLPQFGADFSGIQFIPYLEVVLERLERGELGEVCPLGWTVTVQDSCHARTVAPDFADLPRRVLAAIGVEVREAPHCRETQLCCGIGGGFSHSSAYNPFELLLSARATSRDHRRVRADATCVYCVGCLEMMSVARFADPNRRPVVHLLELVQWAIGESPRRRQGRLAWQFLMGALRRQFPRLVSRERLWVTGGLGGQVTGKEGGRGLRISASLRLPSPVGVRRLGKGWERDGVPVYEGVSYCDAVRRAGEGETLRVLPGSIQVCRWSPVVLGLKGPEGHFEEGLSPRLGYPTAGLLVAPLEDFPGEPEVVIVRASPEVLLEMVERAGRDRVWEGHGGRLDRSALPALLDERRVRSPRLIEGVNRLLAPLARLRPWQLLTRRLFRSGLVTASFDALISRTLADMSICRNSTVVPLLTGRVNISFFCTGGITWGRNQPGYLTSGWPWDVYCEGGLGDWGAG